MVTYNEMQWAAVNTHWSVMRDPPQEKLPKMNKAACQGQLPGGASWPPTILLFFAAMPHADK